MRPDRPWLWPIEPMPVEATPAPVELIVPEGEADHAPIYHRRNGVAEHDCRPRVRARCRACRRRFVLCVAEPGERSAVAIRTWTCGDCEVPT